jgi:UDP-GlcNAc3NAcA epimerase
MKVLTVVGARPQFVKAAVVSRAFAERRGEVVEELLHTGQHYDHGMSQVFFDEMEIPAPVANLGLGGGTHGAATGAMLAGIEKEILARKPDWVLVYGDTNSTLAAALAAAKLHVKVAHVEAGLRSFNRKMPEEVNRVLTDHCSELLFCPSEASKALLAKEGITKGVRVVGDVMIDALLHYRSRARKPDISGPFALATLHRPENTDDPARLAAILGVLGEAPVPVVFPIHPRTREAMKRLGLEARGTLRLVDPLSYFEMLGHLDACRFVLTDSGGLQKEAYVFGKRCVTLRDETEWVELVEAGANRVVGADPAKIRAAFEWAQEPVPAPKPLYGDGQAGQKIVAALLEAA